jgi:hypothetical protein
MGIVVALADSAVAQGNALPAQAVAKVFAKLWTIVGLDHMEGKGRGPLRPEDELDTYVLPELGLVFSICPPRVQVNERIDVKPLPCSPVNEVDGIYLYQVSRCGGFWPLYSWAQTFALAGLAQQACPRNGALYAAQANGNTFSLELLPDNVGAAVVFFANPHNGGDNVRRQAVGMTLWRGRKCWDGRTPIQVQFFPLGNPTANGAAVNTGLTGSLRCRKTVPQNKLHRLAPGARHKRVGSIWHEAAVLLFSSGTNSLGQSLFVAKVVRDYVGLIVGH